MVRCVGPAVRASSRRDRYTLPAVRISVALAARNTERYLRDLLDSLVRQTQPPHELVVCDDASEDATPQLLETFASHAPFPVRIARFSKRQGHVAAFTHAARMCTGQAVAFCDHDDVWLDHKLAVCARELERSGAVLVLHATRLVDRDLRALGRNWPAIDRTRTAAPLALTGLDLDAPGMAIVFRRDLLDVANFDDRPLSRYGAGRQMLHDEWIFFLAGVVGSIRLVDEPLVLYRQHESNDSGGWLDRRRRLTLQPAMADYRRAAAHTGACADYLERTDAEDAELRRRLAAGAEHYRRMSRNWGSRASMYRVRDRRARARHFRRLLARRAYGPRRVGGFGRAAVLKDVVGGLTFRVSASSD
jgi:glycosyltransferase involved in cell wall biosynthesis